MSEGNEEGLNELLSEATELASLDPDGGEGDGAGAPEQTNSKNWDKGEQNEPGDSDDGGEAAAGGVSGSHDTDSGDGGVDRASEGQTDHEEAVGEGEGESGDSSPAEDPERKKLLQKAAILTKRERELQKREKELEAKKSELTPLEQFMAEVKEDKFAAMEKLLGPDTFKQWVERNLKDGDDAPAKPQPDGELKREVEELKKKLESKEEQERNAAEEAEAQKEIQRYSDEIREASRASEFELVNAFGDEYREEAVQFALTHARTYGTVVEPQEAVKRIEDYLRKTLEDGLKTEYGKGLVKKLAGESAGSESDKPKKRKQTSQKLSTTPAVSKPDTPDEDEEAVLKEALMEFEAAHQEI